VQTFYYDGKELEQVDHFKYLGPLGVTFSYNGKFTEGKKSLYTQAQRAMFGIITKARTQRLPIDVQIHLFETMVLPVLSYGSEIWGHENIQQANKLQYKFYRYILHLKTSTPICMLLGELGKVPIECIIKMKIVNYWMKIIDSPDSRLLRKMYNVLYAMHTCMGGTYTSLWISCVETIFNN
jgi:hypothetical protein